MCFVRKPSIVRYIGSILHPVGEGKLATYDRSFFKCCLIARAYGVQFKLYTYLQHPVDTRNTSFVSKVT